MSKFITIEGPDGSGKTTAATRLFDDLQAAGYDVVYTREPGGSEIAEQIRKIVLGKQYTCMDPKTEALLFAASRRQHLVEKILPALKEGKIVICDRYIDSSLAYQGYGRGLGIDEILNVNLFATEGKLPDLTLYFDVDAATGLARINKSNNREVNRLDLAQLEFHNKVRQGYQILVERFPERIKVINASKTPDEVFNQASEILYKFLKEKEACK